MKIHWKIVMFVAIIGMLLGMAVSLWGIQTDNINAAWVGLLTIVAVCVSWWFWVMFVIRTMIDCTDKTSKGLSDIRFDIKEVRNMVQELDSKESR